MGCLARGSCAVGLGAASELESRVYCTVCGRAVIAYWYMATTMVQLTWMRSPERVHSSTLVRTHRRDPPILVKGHHIDNS